MKKPTIKVVLNDINPEPVEIIAASILAISDSMTKINATRLSREAIVALIHDHSGLAKRDIRLVLNNLEALAQVWLKD